MEEKVLEGKKHGMRNLLTGIALMIIGIAGLVYGGSVVEGGEIVIGSVVPLSSTPSSFV